VIVPARTMEKAKANLSGIARVELAALDLLKPVSIDAFAAAVVVASGRPVDMLINSAGIMASPLTRDGRGYEQQFAANHLGHFQLTFKLWPTLAKADGARVVAVSSRGIVLPPSISRIQISNVAITTSGRPTANRRPQTLYLQWDWTAAEMLSAYAPTRCIPAQY
jgi:NAD(P)-dependent dehydrogenase (short-subunit alcohol dehydrogenase family)